MDRFRAQIRRELVFLALGTMESCIVAPLLAGLISWITPLQPPPLLTMGIFLGALLAVHYIARASLQFPLHPLLRYGLLGVGMLASGLLLAHQLLHAQTNLWDPAWLVGAFRDLQADDVLSLDVIVFLLALFVWWRGLVLAQRRLESDTAVSCFRSGLVMMAVTTMVSGFLLPSPPYQFVFAFFFVSLLGVALARAEEVGHQYGGSQSPFGLGWLAMVMVASLGILLLAAGVATLLTGENVSRFLGPIWEVQRVVFTLLAYVLLYAMSWVGNSIIEFLEGIFGELDLLRGIGRALTPPGQGLEGESGESPFTPEQLAVAKAVGVIFGVLLLLLLMTLSLRRLRARAGRHKDEDRESVWEEVNLRRSLRDLWEDGRRRLGGMADALGRSRLGQIFAALTIRRIYAHLGALAEELDYPRALHETPYEYQPTLEQAFPDNCEDVARITEAYVAVHYGEVPDQLADLEKIRTAWERIRKTAITDSSPHRHAPDASAADA